MSTKKSSSVVSESEMKKMELSTRERIAAAPKVQVIIIPDGKDPMWRGCINGVDYKFPKGEVIEVPEPLAEVISNSTKMQEMKAAQEKRLKDLDLGTL